MIPRQFGLRLCRAVILSTAVFAWAAGARAQTTPVQPPPATPAVPQTPAVKADPMAVPGFWDPRRRPERPDLSRINIIRFLTETDYPPFNYAGPDGNPAGFNVDLARMICEEIKVACTVQMRRFDTLSTRSTSNNGDAVIASIAATPEMRAQRRFQRSLLPHAGAFRGAHATARSTIVRPERSRARRSPWSPAPRTRPISRRCSPRPNCALYPNADAARAALKQGDVDLLFGDGISLAFWLNGTDSGDCCVFRGGPYLESRFFGEGVGIAVKRGNDLLRQAFNWALFRLWEKGRFTDLWLRYFPISPF